MLVPKWNYMINSYIGYIIEIGADNMKSTEKKSKQICVFTSPTTVENLKKIAHMKEMSFNHTYHTAFQEYLEHNKEYIQAYDKWKKEQCEEE